MYLNARLKNFWFLTRHFRIRNILRKIGFRLYSETYSIGLIKDLTEPFLVPDAQIPLTVRPLNNDDIPIAFNLKKSELSNNDKHCLVHCLENLEAKISTCYSAVNAEDKPLFTAWLMTHFQNRKIEEHFNGTLPYLAADEALIENVFTLPEFRNKGIMSAAIARIAETGVEQGIRWVIMFIDERNIPSLKASKKAGFYPYLLRKEKWFLFHQTLDFIKPPIDSSHPFQEVKKETMDELCALPLSWNREITIFPSSIWDLVSLH